MFDTRDACPACGGPLSGYDTRKKQFAVMLREGTPHPLHVLVKRFTCRTCGMICYADEPFYTGTRHGSPVVDLCRTLSMTMPFHRTAAYMEHMGIVIDRGTVRNYARDRIRKSRLPISSGSVFPFRSFHSLLSLPGRGVASKGQKRSLPVVSHPHTGQRLTSRCFPNNGIKGITRKAMKNGNPSIQKIADRSSEPASETGSNHPVPFHDTTFFPVLNA